MGWFLKFLEFSNSQGLKVRLEGFQDPGVSLDDLYVGNLAPAVCAVVPRYLGADSMNVAANSPDMAFYPSFFFFSITWPLPEHAPQSPFF